MTKDIVDRSGPCSTAALRSAGTAKHGEVSVRYLWMGLGILVLGACSSSSSGGGGGGKSIGQTCDMSQPAACSSDVCVPLICSDGRQFPVCTGQECSSTTCPTGQRCETTASGGQYCLLANQVATICSSGTGGSGGGTGGSGATGGGGTGGLPCGISWSGGEDPTCDTCTETNCCSEMRGCAPGSGCDALLGCYVTNCQNAGDPSACLQQYCSAELESGGAALQALNDCVSASCPNC